MLSSCEERLSYRSRKKIRNDETLCKLEDILELKLKDLDSKGIELPSDKIIE